MAFEHCEQSNEVRNEAGGSSYLTKNAHSRFVLLFDFVSEETAQIKANNQKATVQPSVRFNIKIPPVRSDPLNIAKMVGKK